MRLNCLLRMMMMCPAALLFAEKSPVLPEVEPNDTVQGEILPADTAAVPQWRQHDALLDSVTGDISPPPSEMSGWKPAVGDTGGATAAAPNGDSTSDLTFDFGITRDNDFNFWPLLHYYRSIDRNRFFIDIAFSLYHREYDRDSGQEHRHLIPLYWHSEKRGGYDTRWLSLFYPSIIRYGTAGEDDLFYFSFCELAPLLNAFSLMRSSDGLYVRNNFLFLLWYKNDNDTGNMHLIFFPVLWWLTNRECSSLTILPFYSHGESLIEKNTYTMLSPFYWNFISDSRIHTTLFPFWWKQTVFNPGDTVNTKLLLPLYWSKKSRDETSRIFFPLIWHFSNQSYLSTTFLPFYSHGRTTDSTGSHFMAASLYWRFASAEQVSSVIFPVWWQRTIYDGTDTTRTRLLLPFYWSKMNRNVRDKVLFPLVWDLYNQHYRSTTVLPLFSQGRAADGEADHLMIASLFWHFRESGATSTTFFPFWWRQTTYSNADTITTNNILPLYWSKTTIDMNYHTFFPIVWQQSGWILGDSVQSLLVLPVYYSLVKNSELIRIIFPLLWFTRNERYQTWTVPPIVSYGHSAAGDAAHLALTPLFWRFTDNSGFSNTLFPFWWQREKRTPDDTVTTNLLLPLYWSKKSAEINDHVIFPIVWKLNGPSYHSTTVLPFFSHGTASDGSGGYLMVSPLYWRFRSSGGVGNMLIPFWWDHHAYDGTDTTETRLVLPLYWSEKNKDVNNHVVFPLVWNLHNQHYRSTTVLPLFSHGSTPDRSSSHLMIASLFWQFHSDNGSSSLLFPLWWRRSVYNSADTTRTTLVVPAYWSEKNEDVNNHVVFPLVWSLNNCTYRSLSVIPFYSAGASSDGSKRYHVITPLYWDIIDNASRDIFLLPLFHYAEKEDTESYCNVCFFLYRYERMKKQYSHNLLWPIANVTKDSDFLSWRIAPLLWYKKSPQLFYFSIQPLFYLSKKEISGHFNILWKVFSWTDEYAVRQSTSILFNALYWNLYADDDFEVRFLYRLFANVKKDGVIEKSFFPFYRSIEKVDGEKSISAFFSIYKYVKRRYPGTAKFYQEDKLFWFLRLRSNHRSLQEKYGKAGEKSRGQ